MASMYGCSDSSKVSGVRHITRSARITGSFMLETLPAESVNLSSYHLQEDVSEIDNVADENVNKSEDSLCHSLLAERRDASHGIAENIRNSSSSPAVVPNGVREVTDEFSRSSPVSRSSSSDDQQYDARERKGLQTIEKLDELLKIKSEREMEVKRERRQMQQQFRTEIEEMVKSKGRDLMNAGASRLLELCACVDSEREVMTEEEEYEPVFPTQVDFELGSGLKYADCGEEPDSPTDVRDGSPEEVDDGQKAPKNFIRRNIQLAGHANEVIAMTDEERRRLDELLADETDLLFTGNPFRKQDAQCAIGYGMTDEERDMVKAIDEKLCALMPLSNVGVMESGLGSSCFSLVKPLSLLDASDGSHATCYRTEDGCKDSNMTMEVLKQRLALVDAELELLTLRSDANSVYDMADRLSSSSLRMLLDVDSRMTSSSLSSHSSERPTSGSVQGSYPGSVDGIFADGNPAASLDSEDCKLEPRCLDAEV